MYKAKKFSILALIAALLLLSAVVSARGNKEPPTISETSGPHYFNPGGEEAYSTATLEFQAKVYVKSEEGYIPESSITIADASGASVRDVTKKGKRDIGFFSAIFADYKEFSVEGELEWDGRDGQGVLLAGGIYFAKLKIGEQIQIRKMTMIK